MKRWNIPAYEKHFNRIKNDAIKEGFTEDELSSCYLDKISHQTKSTRIYRLIRWAYWLGWMRGISDIDSGHTPLVLRDMEVKPSEDSQV